MYVTVISHIIKQKPPVMIESAGLKESWQLLVRGDELEELCCQG